MSTEWINNCWKTAFTPICAFFWTIKNSSKQWLICWIWIRYWTHVEVHNDCVLWQKLHHVSCCHLVILCVFSGEALTADFFSRLKKPNLPVLTFCCFLGFFFTDTVTLLSPCFCHLRQIFTAGPAAELEIDLPSLRSGRGKCFRIAESMRKPFADWVSISLMWCVCGEAVPMCHLELVQQAHTWAQTNEWTDDFFNYFIYAAKIWSIP